MMKWIIAVLLLLGHETLAQAVLSGTVKEINTGEHIPYCHVLVNNSAGAAANSYGFFSVEIPKNTTVELRFTAIGYNPFITSLSTEADTVLSIRLSPKTQTLDEVVVNSVTDESIMRADGEIQLPIAVVKTAPLLLGEKDAMKVLQTLPGVLRGAEGSTALYVRGGTPGQNLIMLDGAPVYNANHLFGFFSVFNADALKSVSFWKSGMPARYGGRLSSVVDIQIKEGNKEKFTGAGGIGLLSSRLTVEGPIHKGKGSFIASARRSYLDLVTAPFMTGGNKQAYNFIDLNLKANYEINSKNKIFISSYFGSDHLIIAEKEVAGNTTGSTSQSRADLSWGNATVTARWNHLVNQKMFLNSSLIYSGFNFKLENKFQRDGLTPRNEFQSYRSLVKDLSAKVALNYFLNSKHTIESGLEMTSHFFTPIMHRKADFVKEQFSDRTERTTALEGVIHIGDTWAVSPNAILQYGVRGTIFNSMGKTFMRAEPRVRATYSLKHSVSIFGSYSRINQFIHLLSNTGIGLSTDLWVPATPLIKPQQSDQFAIGILKSFQEPALTISFETYRKYMRHIISYSENATFLSISDSESEYDWQNNIVAGNGKSYGSEILIEKKTNKFTGWIAYTLSWTVHQFNELNQGKSFFPRHDARHAINTVLSYKISPRIHLSANWVFTSGNALTVPQGYYPTITTNFLQPQLLASTVPYFGLRNSYRSEPSHRLDVGIQFHKTRKHFKRYWEIGVFNVYNRKNPFYYYLERTYYPGPDVNIIDLKKRSLLPIIPSVSYNFEF
ncbi:MAG TPA: carboxypeptidase-like regulatory domain-containing protein [Cyclobacteriaceae bacterium]|nr:carboxypeptidase-like regulatory domain-containing protein [Cyclobacteriaceae bacterium]